VSKVDEALDFLSQRKKSLRATELRSLLESLGFLVSDCGSAGHKKVGHPGLAQSARFLGSSYDAGHGADDQVKACYVGNMMKVLRIYKAELEQLLEKKP
jgi:hypothetical protein